ncbi:TIGR04219 family outer membrane beta-barrel protein [Shewanella surugensis]|uniref:TIGR04219 family outer membrane beta-barrel protein n=1 Tax=Shewanella surugensis TaxID=212020 RepID=A0ABT0LFE5_9GAMM|nr:TIGR04219 family outer membrane beta-barrel protein [Shewanella surugensis]MCL1126424.1 TIGR04219 family outer membrane beta-barrel protein [Shewanella surugensis]
MKKTLLACALFSSFTGLSAQASTLLGFKAGVDYWRADTSGTLGSNGSSQQGFDYSDGSQGSIWFAFEHPVPIIPNVKIRENRLVSDGSTSSANFTFDGVDYTGSADTRTDLSNTDFILYYELLDNDIVSLDVGGAYKKMHGSIRVSNSTSSSKTGVNSGIVMGYVDAMASLPGFGLYGFTNVMVGVNESNVYDYSLGLGWKIEGLALDYNLRVGYREFMFDVNDFSDVTTDLKSSGYFAGLEVVF